MPDAPDNKPLVHRRGPDGRMEVGPDWETLIDRQIREAIADGRFDDLPHHAGSRSRTTVIAAPGSSSWRSTCSGTRASRRQWIEADKEVRDLLGRRDAILARAAAGPAPSAMARRRERAGLEELVVRIQRGGRARERGGADRPPAAPGPRSVAAELARYDEACRR